MTESIYVTTLSSSQVQHWRRPGDAVHIVHAVCCLLPKLEVYHSAHRRKQPCLAAMTPAADSVPSSPPDLPSAACVCLVQVWTQELQQRSCPYLGCGVSRHEPGSPDGCTDRCPLWAFNVDVAILSACQHQLLALCGRRAGERVQVPGAGGASREGGRARGAGFHRAHVGFDLFVPSFSRRRPRNPSLWPSLVALQQKRSSSSPTLALRGGSVFSCCGFNASMRIKNGHLGQRIICQPLRWCPQASAVRGVAGCPV